MHAADHNSLVLNLSDEAATLALGARLSGVLRPGWVIYLDGDLGAGKTTLVRGALRAMGYAGRVKSPTYTLVEVHVISGLHLYHFDFYRLNQAEEYLDAGLDEYFAGGGACLVEWPERAGPYLPPADLRIHLSIAGSGRKAAICSISERGQKCLTSLVDAVSAGAKSSNTPPPA